MSTKLPKNVFLNTVLKLSLRRFLNFVNIFSHSKVTAGQSWLVFGVMSALIQNNRAKMTEKVPKIAIKWQKNGKNGNNCPFMLSKSYFLVTIQQ